MASPTLIFNIGDAVAVEGVIELGYLERFDVEKGWVVRENCIDGLSRTYNVPPTMMKRAMFKSASGDGFLIVPNELSASWKQPLSISFELEVARSSRVRCFHCNEPIEKGVVKAGAKTVMYVYHGCKNINISIDWFHVGCFPVLQSNMNVSCAEYDLLEEEQRRELETRIELAQSKWKACRVEIFKSKNLILNRQQKFERVGDVITESRLQFKVPRPFAEAARNAVSGQVQKFKREVFRTGAALECPATGKTMTTSECHIHHQYPHSFRDIVKLFILRSGIENIEELRVVGSEFKDYSLRRSFSDFHKRHARLVAVHPDSNATIPRRPRVGTVISSSADVSGTLTRTEPASPIE